MTQMRRFFRQSPVTAAILALTVLYFLWIQVRFLGQATSALAIFEAGGINGYYLAYNPVDLWRLLSPVLIHIGWEHLVMNAISIYFVGIMAEQWWGARRYLLIYLLAGLMGNVFVAFFTPEVVSAGASTSIFGLFTAISVVGYFGRHPYLKQVGQNFQMLLGMNLLFNLFMPSISIAGHLGGALGGGLAGMFLSTAFEKNMFSKSQRLLALLAYVTVAAILLSLSLMRRM